MGLKKTIDETKKENKGIEGEATKDNTYSSKNKISDEGAAVIEFKRAVEKLFNVNGWSDLPGVSSSFQLYDRMGKKKYADKPKLRDYIKILLPGPIPENWVVVTDIKEGKKSAEFTVSPSRDPTAKGEEREEIKHFFIKEATSTFKVELRGMTIYAYEIGMNEGINNKGEEAGKREIINTLIAEGGWAGFQKYQWKKLTDYLVHKEEIE
jgi:hypothetical protein